jgi:hypothetical protein
MGALTILLIAAFGIDRLVTGLFFLLSFSDDLRPLLVEDPAHPNDRAARARRLIYAIVAGYLGIVVVAGILQVRLFDMAAPMGAKPNPLVDALLTGMILAAGADRIADIVKSFGTGAVAAKKPEDKPVEITGRLILEHPVSATVGGVTEPAFEGQQAVVIARRAD